jgi:hypothetical protein
VFAIFLLAQSARSEEVSVEASVDQRKISLGESVQFTVTVRGVRGDIRPEIPAVDGLAFQGPFTQQQMTFVNGAVSQWVNLVYTVTPTRTGDFTLPSVALEVKGKTYRTQPIAIIVEKAAAAKDISDMMFLRVVMDSQKLYLGQTMPVHVLLLARQNVPVKGVSSFNADAPGLGYKFLPNLKQGSRVIDGEVFNIIQVEGALSPERTGKLSFGPVVMKVQLAVEKRGRRGSAFDDPFFDQFFGRTEVREVPLTWDAIPIEVMPLPAEGRPADFTGAVGRWNLEVTAKPTDVAVGDPVTLMVKIAGDGNLDTVPRLEFDPGEGFKAYDPTTKSTKNELGTQGERDFQQVLIPKSTEAKQIPAFQFSFFDPIAGRYQTLRRDPIVLNVRPAGGGIATVIGGDGTSRRHARLGEDIVYLKGSVGAPATVGLVAGQVGFAVLNLAPLIGLAVLCGWKRRREKLAGNVALARRSRAAKRTRDLLQSATDFAGVHAAMRCYIGDRLNIPEEGITASVVEERLLPAGMETALADRVRQIFEVCDAARFAGGAGGNWEQTRNEAEKLVDELERSDI